MWCVITTWHSMSFLFYSVHCTFMDRIFMDGDPTCSLAGNNLGPNGMRALCTASSSLSNITELK